MSNFVYLTVFGLIGFIVIRSVFGRLADNSGEINLEEERRLTESQGAN